MQCQGRASVPGHTRVRFRFTLHDLGFRELPFEKYICNCKKTLMVALEDSIETFSSEIRTRSVDRTKYEIRRLYCKWNSYNVPWLCQPHRARNGSSLDTELN